MLTRIQDVQIEKKNLRTPRSLPICPEERWKRKFCDSNWTERGIIENKSTRNVRAVRQTKSDLIPQFLRINRKCLGGKMVHTTAVLNIKREQIKNYATPNSRQQRKLKNEFTNV